MEIQGPSTMPFLRKAYCSIGIDCLSRGYEGAIRSVWGIHIPHIPYEMGSQGAT